MFYEHTDNNFFDWYALELPKEKWLPQALHNIANPKYDAMPPVFTIWDCFDEPVFCNDPVMKRIMYAMQHSHNRGEALEWINDFTVDKVGVENLDKLYGEMWQVCEYPVAMACQIVKLADALSEKTPYHNYLTRYSFEIVVHDDSTPTFLFWSHNGKDYERNLVRDLYAYRHRGFVLLANDEVIITPFTLDGTTTITNLIQTIDVSDSIFSQVYITSSSSSVKDIKEELLEMTHGSNDISFKETDTFGIIELPTTTPDFVVGGQIKSV